MPRRHDHLFDRIASFQALHNAARRAVKGKRKKQIKFATARIDIPTGETAKVELKLTAKGRKLIKWATTGENRASKFRGTIRYGSAQAKVKIKLK